MKSSQLLSTDRSGGAIVKCRKTAEPNQEVSPLDSTVVAFTATPCRAAGRLVESNRFTPLTVPKRAQTPHNDGPASYRIAAHRPQGIDRALGSPALMVSEMNRTEPSHMATLPPPGW